MLTISFNPLGVNAGTAGWIIPAGSRRVSYLESNGSQYIDLGITDESPDFFAEVDVEILIKGDVGSPFGAVRIGAYTSVVFTSVTEVWHAFKAANSIRTILSSESNKSIKLSKSGLAINDLRYNTPIGNATVGNLYLFARRVDGDVPGRLFIGRMSKALFPTLELYPFVDRNDRPHMLDVKTGTAYYNQGTGADFKTGPYI